MAEPVERIFGNGMKAKKWEKTKCIDNGAIDFVSTAEDRRNRQVGVRQRRTDLRANEEEESAQFG